MATETNEMCEAHVRHLIESRKEMKSKTIPTNYVKSFTPLIGCLIDEISEADWVTYIM